MQQFSGRVTLAYNATTKYCQLNNLETIWISFSHNNTQYNAAIQVDPYNLIAFKQLSSFFKYVPFDIISIINEYYYIHNEPLYEYCKCSNCAEFVNVWPLS